MRWIGMLLGLTLLGCAGAPKAPDWVDGNAGAYPKDGWLLGRGAGSSVAVAQERARADLAKNFSLAIRAVGEDRQRAETGTGAEGYRGIHEQRIESRSEVALRGVRIAELWRDPESGEQHALAAVSRLQVAQALRAEMSELDRGIDGQIAAAQAAADPLAQLGPASRALALAEERDALQALLRVLDTTGVGYAARHGSERLRADRDALFARLPIAVRADGDPAFAETVAGALAAAGFASGGDRDYRLDAALDARDLGLQEGWHWLRATVTIVLRDTQGNLRGQRSWAFKASAADAGGAYERLRREIERTLGDELRETIAGFGG